MSFREEGITYDMRCAWAGHLLSHIQFLSDLDYQRRLWIEGIPGLLDSWEERMCMFFDDQNIDEFLADIDPEFGLSQHQINELWKLRNKVRAYSSDVYKSLKKQWKDYADPREIIADPRWHEVVACAQETLKAFESYEVPRDDQKEA